VTGILVDWDGGEVLVSCELCEVPTELWETAVFCDEMAEMFAEGVGCIWAPVLKAGAPAWKAPAPVAMIPSTRKSMSSYRGNGVVCQRL
jgi:hypothetical protein